MRKIKPLMIGAALVAFAVVLASCGDGDEGSEGTGAGVRTIEVSMLDELRFEPSSAEVGVGETVRFVLRNEGEMLHDFSLGEAMSQGDMDMGSGSGASDEAVVVDPGQTGELTYTFGEAGEVAFACHQPGHLEAGMVFTVQVA